MDYLVLARKWRPQVFEDVVGQDRVQRSPEKRRQAESYRTRLSFQRSEGHRENISGPDPVEGPEL